MKLKILDEKGDQQEIEMFIFIYVYINQKLWIIMKPKTLRKFRTYNTGTKSK